MDGNLRTCGTLGIPQTLMLAHEQLCAQLARAAMESGQVGKAAKRVEELCVPHFAKEEEIIFPVFGLLHDLATDRVRPEMAAALPMISGLSARRDASRDHHRLIDMAIEELLQQARKDKSKTIANVAHALRDHERAEDEVMYPAILSIGQSLRESLGVQR